MHQYLESSPSYGPPVPVGRPSDHLVVVEFTGNRSILKGAATMIMGASYCELT